MLVDPTINDDSTDGRGVRRAVSYVASVTQRGTREMTGTELGYRHENLPVVASEQAAGPRWRRVLHPHRRPGARLPHVWLSESTRCTTGSARVTSQVAIA